MINTIYYAIEVYLSTFIFLNFEDSCLNWNCLLLSNILEFSAPQQQTQNITLFDTKNFNYSVRFTSIDHNDWTLHLTCILYTSILTFAHPSCFTHVYNNTFSLYHFTWEFKKPFLISFITLHFIQPKINGLLKCNCKIYF